MKLKINLDTYARFAAKTKLKSRKKKKDNNSWKWSNIRKPGKLLGKLKKKPQLKMPSQKVKPQLKMPSKTICDYLFKAYLKRTNRYHIFIININLLMINDILIITLSYDFYI